MKLRLLCGLCLCTAAALGIWAASAGADPNAVPICATAGPALSGTYNNLTVTGNAYVAAGTTLTVKGTLTLAPNACLDAFTLGTVHVTSNVVVGKGATLGLGCTPNAIGPGPPCNGVTTNDTVGGSIIANQALTMYIDGVTIGGALTSTGGGPGLLGEFLNFPVKDNTIRGNVSITGWQGGWFGFIRNHVGGQVVYSNNASVQDPDAGEVVTNTIAGNLTCQGNSPAVQVGDSGGLPNTVGGHKVGQCAAPGL